MAALAVQFPAWHWNLHPEVLLLVGAMVGGYLYVVERFGPDHVEAIEFPATRRQKTWWLLGCATILVAASYPVHELSERSLYSVHMVQHMLLSLVAPALLLLGTPAWLMRLALRPRWLLATVRFLTRPLLALVIFNAVLVFTHWPLVVTAAVHSEIAHFATHTLLFTSALIMWMPVLSPLLEVPRLSHPGRMLYLFLQSLVPTVPASFLTFGHRPLYHVYEPFTRPWGISALADQRMAGLIMKIAGGLLLWSVIAVLFFRWYELEQREGVDVLEWHDVDRALDRAGVARP